MQGPARIFNVGLNRAGTTSLGAALRLLGLRAAHHRHGGVRLYDIAIRNIHAGRRVFFGIDQQYDAFSDFAGHNFFDLLDRQYPGSKFILTTRELNAWLDSRERKVEKNRKNPGYRNAFLTVDREQWARDRERYLARLQAYFRSRPQDLLIIDIPGGEGWEKLCAFLGKEVPAVPFPFRNVSAVAVETAGVKDAENSVGSPRAEGG